MAPRRAPLLALLTCAALPACGADEPLAPADRCFDGATATGTLRELVCDRSDRFESVRVSSADPSGGNADFGLVAPGNSVLYIDDEGRNVIFDRAGPGVLTRVWFTHFSVLQGLGKGTSLNQLSGRIGIFIDDETTPRVDRSLQELFGGAASSAPPLASPELPFAPPFALGPDASLGGFVLQLPIAYRRRVVVTTSELVPYVNVDAYDDSEKSLTRDVTGAPPKSFDPTADVSALAAEWSGEGSLFATGDEIVTETTLPADGSAALELPGAGTLTWLELSPSSPLQHGASLRLVIDVDGGTANVDGDGGAPEVDVPLGDFFSAPLSQVETGGRLARRTADGRYVSAFPMPFTDGLRVRVVGNATLSVQIRTNHLSEIPNTALRFVAQHVEASAGVGDPDLTLASMTGRGHYVALSLAICCQGTPGACDYLTGNHAHLEGDESFEIDGAVIARGTGLEDYFNAGFYYAELTPGLLSTHGMPYAGARAGRGPADAFDCVTQYRQHLGDPMPFRERFALSLEHGPEGKTPVWLSAVSAFYVVRP